MNTHYSIPPWLLPHFTERKLAANSSGAAFQQKQWEHFLQQGLPNHKKERWKYADLTWLTTPFAHERLSLNSEQTEKIKQAIAAHKSQYSDVILLVLINGEYDATYSDALPAQMTASSSLSQNHVFDTDNIIGFDNPFVSLNAAMFTSGLYLKIDNQVELAKPLHILSLNIFSQPTIIHPRYYFELGAHSRVNIIQHYFSLTEQAYFTNQVTQINLASSAQLTLTKIQREAAKVIHFSYTHLQQAKDSLATLLQFSLGARFSRDEIQAFLNEPGANCHSGGFYHLQNDGQYNDYHVDIHHTAPYSHSEMFYKGVLQQQSRAVFNGRLYVAPNAQKILAYQANHNLLLSKNAEVYSKPELEIYADDVQCKHGATVGQLDEEALFYLRARGISQAEAVQLLLQGFVDEIVQRIPCQAVKQQILLLMGLL